MAGVGDEAALDIHRLFHPPQKPIDCGNEWPNFYRQWPGGNRLQFMLATLVDFDGEVGHRPENFANEIGYDEQQDRNEYQERHHGTQCTIPRDFVTDSRLLGHRQTLPGAKGVDQDPICFIAGPAGLHPIQQVLRQCQ